MKIPGCTIARALTAIVFLVLSFPPFLPAADVAPETSRERAPGAREVRAMARAYPGRVETASYRDGQWALRIDGEWFYWAEGRFLPRSLRDRWEDFVSIRFYNYTTGEPGQREITPELEERLRSRLEHFSNDGGARFNRFLDTLYQVSSREEAERTMQAVSFLGHRTRVHPLLVGPLDRVDQRIRTIILVDGDSRRFVRDLSQVHGYNWRDIAGTPRRSYHSYGIAVDLLPRSFNQRHAYWRWAVNSGVTEWWNIPRSKRWNVPQPIVDAFEAEGFIWGGKWLSFDNIHFEYRPEILLLVRAQK